MTGFHDLYESYSRDVYRFALYLSGDPALADDITSETFVRVWSSPEPIRFARPLEAALRLNSEETSTLVLLGEVALGLGKQATAERCFTHACQANARAVNAWFLRGYIAWKRQDRNQAVAMLSAARTALGQDWKPAGALLEGDVKRRMHNECGFLSVFVQQWDGSPAPERAYSQLDQYLRQFR